MPTTRRTCALRLQCGWLAGLLLLSGGCVPVTGPEAPATRAAGSEPAAPSNKFNFVPKSGNDPHELQTAELSFPYFVDAAAACGIQHTYENGATPKALMVESTGGGCGWLDYDLDGQIDLFLTQGGIPDAPADMPRPPDALYRQIETTRFVNVTAQARVEDRHYGQGVAAGDIDNDGFCDLFVTNVGQCTLYLNQGDGTFVEISERLVGKRQVWSASAAWGDVDRDGDLDLYVCNYTIYDPYHPIECRNAAGIDAICHPRNVEPEPDEFFLNNGDGTFTEMSRIWGLYGPGNKGLGVVIADLTGDLWPDIYVANDTLPNFLFVNENGRKFKESALVLGAAVSGTGEPQASMGVAFGDYDQNGFPDLCLTHFTGEGFTLYQNQGAYGFQDVTGVTGLREFTMSKLGFGTVMSDFNLDGHMDLIAANGHIDPRFGNSEGYEMNPQLFSFDGVHWQDGAREAGEFFSQKLVGRGVATADYDRDGDLDVCVVNQNSPTALLRNDSKKQHGLRVQALGIRSNRQGIGVKATVAYDGRKLVAEMAGGTSFAASHERTLFFGLGDWAGPCRVEIVWPSGIIDVVETSEPDQLIRIREGESPVRADANAG